MVTEVFKPVAVSGTRRAIKELVDGTIRVSVDVDPQYRQAFFALFPEIDMAVVLAPLNTAQGLPERTERASEDHQATPPHTPPRPDPEKGYTLVQLAGMLCKLPKFWQWLHDVCDYDCQHEEDAAMIVRKRCGVKSRSELVPENVRACDCFRSMMHAFHSWEAENDDVSESGAP